MTTTGTRLALSLIFLIVSDAAGQEFTRIIDSPVSTDGGDSRSVNWADYDRDGDLDLFITNGHNPGQDNFFYINNGDGSFSATDSLAITQDGGRSDGASWGDFDNDDDLDLYVVNWYNDQNLFYENQGTAGFQQMTEGAIASDGGYSETCSWGDANGDGFIDLYVTNSGLSSATRNFFYVNDGASGSFTRITDSAPVLLSRFARSVNWADIDGDGDSDLFVSNENNQPNELYRNQLIESGTADFVLETEGPVVADAGSSISGSWGDYDNDGDFDLFVANLGQNNVLYQNDGQGSFTRVESGPHVSDGGNSFGSSWGDLDNDGDLDLFVANGWGTGDQDNFLYRNLLMEEGTASFEKIERGPVVTDGGWSYGSSFADYDNDGDLDLVVAKWLNSADENNALFRNELPAGGHWLQVELRGTVSNHAAIGARIRVKAVAGGSSGLWQLRHISGQDSYCGQNLRAHFGLGDAPTVDSVEVLWPSGIIQVLTAQPLDTLLEIVEPPATSIETQGTRLPETGGNLSSYPNPFNPGTNLRFDVAGAAPVSLSIFDLRGRRVRTLLDGVRGPGAYEVRWDGRDGHGQSVVSGLYLSVLNIGQLREVHRLLLLR